MAASHPPVNIQNRLELFVDRLLIDSLQNVHFKLHEPRLAGGPSCPEGAYVTILRDDAAAPMPYRAYFRTVHPDYTADRFDGHPGEITSFAQSADGITWEYPSLGLLDIHGSRDNNHLFSQSPYCHNFAPFVDRNPDCPTRARYKALTGLHPTNGHASAQGLYAFESADGIHWSITQTEPVVTFPEFAFDSQNIAFWSDVEKQYVCYYRMWKTPHGKLRSIARATSPDFIHWTPGQPMNPNLPGEHLYTSQITPYFRAPHIYLALPTRYQPDRGSSTDLLFMSTRAGSEHFDRLFTQAFIRPGLDPNRWGNRSNYAAAGIHPAGDNPNEISLYHKAGMRYTLRTDGFISLHAGYEMGTVLTQPLLFKGDTLTLNMATSAAGSVRVELQDETGKALPGRALEDCPPTFGDCIRKTITWTDGPSVGQWQGQPVRLKFELREADIYAMQFDAKA